MGTALSTTKPPEMPPDPKQEPLLSFIRRWEKKLGTLTDSKQKPGPETLTGEKCSGGSDEDLSEDCDHTQDSDRLLILPDDSRIDEKNKAAGSVLKMLSIHGS